MPVEIRVPQLGESIVEATIAQWLKQPGDAVAVGDSLVELETEKVNQTVEAEVAGTLSAFVVNEGDTVGVGQVIATINESGTATSSAPAATGTAPATQSGEAATPAPGAQDTGSGYGAPATPEANPTTPATPLPPATPVAQSMAQANGVDLSGVKATGPGGKIGKNDVAGQLAGTQPAAAPPQPAAPTPPPARPAAPVASTSNGRPEERVKMTTRRRTIARRLVEAQQTAAMLTTFNEVDMTAVMELRKRRKDDFSKRFGVNLGFMSFFTKASIGALKQFPTVNAEIQNDEIVLKKFYDIGIAVGAEEGLVVPVVRDADKLTFAQIEKEIGALAGKARENKLSIAEMTGGTFTITNGGVFGSLMSTPILNTPQVGILGLHAIKERPMVVDGQIVARPMMYVALSYDHRIIDGSTAVRFLVKLKELIEDPESLLLEG